ncbi:hypothetical protein [Actinocrispum wychmicini]|uniref:Uncharacterized protein n=1 Tax=Actinocrispum wychmicini TaxID=1213861 RepID=A0A4R2J6V3_9PSEU|nr:hypothetical protein [Actinocrispum wychmicini]TCO54783.1 hypothetical protein EV192_10871 [Actinocrispum wychmicini]
MTDVDRNRDGVVDLHVEAATKDLWNVGHIGTTFSGAWQAALAKIRAPGSIGKGSMGKQFTSQYGPAAESVIAETSKVEGWYKKLANNGYRGVQIYQGVDAEAAARLFPE